MTFKSGKSYHAYHIPSGEGWRIIGVRPWGDRLCAAGWPPSTGRISDCKDFVEHADLTEEELDHRESKFGKDWL